MATKSNKTTKTVVSFKSKNNIDFKPAKAMASKKTAKRRSTVYESVVQNIQKITSPTGNVSYRVRVSVEGEKYDAYTTSLKKARSLKKEFMG